ncbi:hypothetical protein QL285_072319 [Trifolium repens]|nr:hypothetical protein QL285_072319 [Trifolium repens]
MVNPTWGGGDVRLHSHNQHQPMHHHLVEKQDLFLGTSSPTSSYKESNSHRTQQQQQQQLQNTTAATLSNNQHLPTGLSQTFHRNTTNPFSERCKMFCDNNNSSSSNSFSCALSLLSSPVPPQTHDHHHENRLNDMVNTTHSSFMQPLGLSLHDHSLGSVDSVLGSNDQNAHCSSIYNMGSNDQSHSHEGNHNEAPPLFPFQWD